MIKAVIFDLDDTLCNASEVLDKTLRKVFEENLAHYPDKTVEEMVALNKQAFKDVFLDPSIPVPSASILIWFRIFELMGKKPPVRAIMRIVEGYWEENTRQLKTTPGTFELLDYLEKSRIKIGVLTNGAFMGQAKKLSILGLDDKIDCFVASDMCLCDKPDPKAFLYILEKMNILPHEAIMVGDRMDNDVLGAKKLGMKGVLVKSRFAHQEEICQADLEVEDLSDIINFIEKTNTRGQINSFLSI